MKTASPKSANPQNWQVQEAKARFSELLRASAEHGPQIVSHHGKPTVVVVPFAQWQRIQQQPKPDLKELLLGSPGRGDLNIPSRKQFKLLDRPPLRFDD